MTVVDLSHFISPDMPVYPGTQGPKITDATSIRHDGFAEKLLTFYSHTGTHMDAPGHILEGGKTLDRFEISRFLGPGMVIDARETGRVLTLSLLEKHHRQIARAEFVLFLTGWSGFWGKPEYFLDFPTLSPEAADWISGFKHLKGLGFDCISADPVGADPLANHAALLSQDLVIIENLCNLDQLAGKQFTFCCLPLKIEDADGSPVRAVGFYG